MNPECVYQSERYKVFQDDEAVWLQLTSDAHADLSFMHRNSPLQLTPYASYMLQPLAFIEAPRAAILIGLGGGQQAKFIHRYFPHIHLTALELDAEAVDIARRHFALPDDDAHLRIVIGDGAGFIEQHQGTFDLILSDAFGDGNCLVDALHTEQFYRSCHRLLGADGVMTVNIYRPDAAWGVGYLSMLQKMFAEFYWIALGSDHFVLVLCKDHVSRRWPAIAERAALIDANAALDSSALVARLSRPKPIIP